MLTTDQVLVIDGPPFDYGITLGKVHELVALSRAAAPEKVDVQLGNYVTLWPCHLTNYFPPTPPP